MQCCEESLQNQKRNHLRLYSILYTYSPHPCGVMQYTVVGPWP
jgi:hypothetical protein